MLFNGSSEFVYLQHDAGEFKNEETGQLINWTKVVFADPSTFENHELAFREHVDFSKCKKGDRIILELLLEPTKKKSRVVVNNFELI